MARAIITSRLGSLRIQHGTKNGDYICLKALSCRFRIAATHSMPHQLLFDSVEGVLILLNRE
ncbi:MAG: hypothetical protein ABW185_00045 [Sedimenticola sp.]